MGSNSQDTLDCFPNGLPFERKDYLAPVDLTGSATRHNQRGYFSASHITILKRLNIN
ncbi:hypothetical protein [Alginatibacterium sediminis]|uniref:hypothetical protein n=1 Tax=Alginatibacterium sediminis TaxID=2164068 RepID=UPI0013146EE0|nr:hypothetical protein [Alginatibacterium sediminis]